MLVTCKATAIQKVRPVATLNPRSRQLQWPSGARTCRSLGLAAATRFRHEPRNLVPGQDNRAEYPRKNLLSSKEQGVNLSRGRLYLRGSGYFPPHFVQVKVFTGVGVRSRNIDIARLCMYIFHYHKIPQTDFRRRTTVTTSNALQSKLTSSSKIRRTVSPHNPAEGISPVIVSRSYRVAFHSSLSPKMNVTSTDGLLRLESDLLNRPDSLASTFHPTKLRQKNKPC